MTYAAKVIADSIAQGVRLTTLEVTMPRIVLAEFNTHRVFSRNSASSRAIPVEKRIAAIRANPFIPDAFGANQRGMQAGESLDDGAQQLARSVWEQCAKEACQNAATFADLGVHKQWANRLLEPYSWTTVVVTATEWANFFGLRCNPEAQPEIRRAAELMREAMATSTPTPMQMDQRLWHAPYAQPEDAALDLEQQIKVCVARCARVSYLTHDGKRDPAADIILADRLLASGHMSPFEHCATPTSGTRLELDGVYKMPFGNFREPWLQYRKMLHGEAVFGGAR